MILHEKISEQLPKWRERVRALAKEHADVVVDTVTIGEVVGGMRDTKSLLTDISYVDPAEGIRFRGMTIPEVLKALPKARGAKMPMVGGLYYLLIVGEVPTKEQALEVEAEWAKRAEVPDYVFKMLKSNAKRNSSDDSPFPGCAGFTKRIGLYTQISQHKKGCLLGGSS